MRDNYVICMKNAMFWHFGTSEIRDVLEDVSLHFESGLRDGLSENDILEQYGEPRDAVSIIKKEEGCTGNVSCLWQFWFVCYILHPEYVYMIC